MRSHLGIIIKIMFYLWIKAVKDFWIKVLILPFVLVFYKWDCCVFVFMLIYLLQCKWWNKYTYFKFLYCLPFLDVVLHTVLAVRAKRRWSDSQKRELSIPKVSWFLFLMKSTVSGLETVIFQSLWGSDIELLL